MRNIFLKAPTASTPQLSKPDYHSATRSSKASDWDTIFA
jgi:hypothetical protein